MKKQVFETLGTISMASALIHQLITPAIAQQIVQLGDDLTVREKDVTELLPETIAEARATCKGEDDYRALLHGTLPPEMFEQRLVACALANEDYEDAEGKTVNHNDDLYSQRFLNREQTYSPVTKVIATKDATTHLFQLKHDGEQTYLIDVSSPAVVGGNDGYHTPWMRTNVKWMLKMPQHDHLLDEYVKISFAVYEQEVEARAYRGTNTYASRIGSHDYHALNADNALFSAQDRAVSHGCVRNTADMQRLIHDILGVGSQVFITGEIPDEQMFAGTGEEVLTGQATPQTIEGWQEFAVTARQGDNGDTQYIAALPPSVYERLQQYDAGMAELVAAQALATTSR